MLSYFDYKLISEEEAAASGGSPAAPDPAGLPSPATGLPPGGSSGGPPIGGMGGGPGLMGSDSIGGPSIPGMDMGSPSAGSPPKSLELKYSNVWDAFEKLLKKYSNE